MGKLNQSSNKDTLKTGTSLRTKFMLLFAGGFVAIISVILLVNVFIKDIYQDAIIEKTKIVGLNLHQNIFDLLTLFQRLDRLEKLDEELTRLVKEGVSGVSTNLAYCYVTDPAGKIIYHSESNKMGNSSQSPLLTRVLAKMAPQQPSYVDTKSANIEIGIPLWDTEMKEIMGGIFMGIPKSVIVEKLGAVNTIFLSLGLVLAMAMAVVWFVVSRKLVSPLHEMSDFAEVVAKGDFSRELQPKSSDEVGALANKLNEMVRDLRDKVGLQASYEKLRELDQLKSQFFANVSHELRTPLTMSLAPLESVLRGEKGEISQDTDKYLQIVHQNSLRLLKLINDLLDFSKVEAGKMKLKVAENDIVKLAQILLTSVDSWAERSQIAVEFAAEAGVPRIYFDKDKIEKVILNLLSNAIKFSRPGGKINLRVSRIDEKVRVTVSDNGIGIPEDELHKVFERFSQLDSSASGGHRGTGIGLSLAKELVELHNGEIWVESERGKGSTFAFEFPIGKDHFDPALLDQRSADVKEPVLEGEEEREGAGDGEVAKEKIALQMSDLDSGKIDETRDEIAISKEGAPKVLIVEDHVDLRTYVADLLSKDYEVHTAADGEEGMTRIRQIIPSLVISDVMMPKKDGYQLTREVREDPAIRHIPIILLTARVDIGMKIEGLLHGANDYLTKPFNSKELLVRVANLIRMKQMEKQLAEYSKELEIKVQEQVEEIQRKARLEKYLAPQVVESILESGEFQMATATRKKLTFMFTDIRGFTDLSDSLEPEETTTILNDYLSEMTKIIFEHGGTIDKFLGDGIMLFFGDPIPQDDHALRAVRCAQAMNKRLQELQKKWFPAGGRELQIGTGINSGYATVGNFGSADRMEYTAIGNQVNLAARLQTLAEAREIVTSSSTYGLVKEQVQAEEKGIFDIKGFARPIQVWRLK